MKIYRRVAALAIMTTLSGIAGGAEIIVQRQYEKELRRSLVSIRRNACYSTGDLRKSYIQRKFAPS